MASLRISAHDLRLLSLRTRLLIGLPALALLGVALWIATQFLHPVPPRQVVLATGPEGGALHRLGQAYAERLQREGIKVELRATAGTGENIRLVESSPPGVDVAFVLAGTAEAPQRLVNLSNLFYAPLFALTRGDDAPRTLAALRGKRLAVGVPGSGLARVLEPLLAANGVTRENSTLVELPDAEAVRRFAAGEVDILFSGEGLRSPAVVAMLSQPGVALMDFERADSYARHYPNLLRLDLPPGGVDLAQGIPSGPIRLIGTTLMLVAKQDLHPTLVDLFVDASREVNSKPGYFERSGEFPNLTRVDAVPVSEQALIHAAHGPSLLRRYLPLWLADFLQRLLTLAIPLLAVALPLFRLLPAIVDHVFQDRIDHGYAELRKLEAEAATGARPAADIHTDLVALAQAVRRIRVPIAYVTQLYALRRHVDEIGKAVGGGSAGR